MMTLKFITIHYILKDQYGPNITLQHCDFHVWHHQNLQLYADHYIEETFLSATFEVSLIFSYICCILTNSDVVHTQEL